MFVFCFGGWAASSQVSDPKFPRRRPNTLSTCLGLTMVSGGVISAARIACIDVDAGEWRLNKIKKIGGSIPTLHLGGIS